MEIREKLLKRTTPIHNKVHLAPIDRIRQSEKAGSTGKTITKSKSNPIPKEITDNLWYPPNNAVKACRNQTNPNISGKTNIKLWPCNKAPPGNTKNTKNVAGIRHLFIKTLTKNRK